MVLVRFLYLPNQRFLCMVSKRLFSRFAETELLKICFYLVSKLTFLVQGF